MLRVLGWVVAWMWLSLVPIGPAAAQAGLRPVPPLSGRVVDETGTLNAAQAAALSGQLEAVERRHGAQWAVLIVNTTAPEDIAAYALRVGQAWKIGRRDVGDGLLIVVAKADRQARIEVAKALEGDIPDVAAYRVIQGALVPAFRAGDYAGGLRSAIDQLVARLPGESAVQDGGASSPSPGMRPGSVSDSSSNGGEGSLAWIGGLVVLGLAARAVLGRGRGAVVAGGAATAVGTWATASLGTGLTWGVAAVVAALSIGRGMGWGGMGALGGGGWGGGGGSSGGGFSSGGGGDFGGGGASGGW